MPPAKKTPKLNDASIQQPSTEPQETESMPLATLAAELGEPPATLLEGRLAGMTNAELLALGKTISSQRIVTDATRIYHQAWDFWSKATAPQKKLLRGFSRELLAVAVHEAMRLEEMVSLETSGERTAATKRSSVAGNLDTAFGRALALRDQAFTALGEAAGQDRGRAGEIKAARGTANDGVALAAGLVQMAKVLRGWEKASKTDQALRTRLALASVDGSYASELEAAAAAVKTATGRMKKSVATRKVSQAELDRADGINIVLLRQVLRTFEAAHAVDPMVPRLVPISTRHLFSRGSGKRPKKPTGAKAVAPAAAPSAKVASKAGKKLTPSVTGQPVAPADAPEIAPVAAASKPADGASPPPAGE
jgi:hypothetical protein